VRVEPQVTSDGHVEPSALPRMIWLEFAWSRQIMTNCAPFGSQMRLGPGAIGWPVPVMEAATLQVTPPSVEVEKSMIEEMRESVCAAIHMPLPLPRVGLNARPRTGSVGLKLLITPRSAHVTPPSVDLMTLPFAQPMRKTPPPAATGSPAVTVPGMVGLDQVTPPSVLREGWPPPARVATTFPEASAAIWLPFVAIVRAVQVSMAQRRPTGLASPRQKSMRQKSPRL
jgi:hypothetical protein